MWLLGDLADWWDARRRETDAILDDWVRDAGRGSDAELFAVVLTATLTHTAMEVGAGFVDVLRFGRGIAQGTVGGVVHDGLRLLTVAGPATGRVLRFSSRLLTRLVSAASDIASDSNICTFVAAANALRQTGAQHFATVYDVLRAAGMSLVEAGAGAWVEQLVPALRALGANPVVRHGVHSVEQLAAVLRAAGGRGVAMFSVFWQHPTMGTVGHTMVAFLEGGQLRILDRTGRVFRSFAELEQFYGNIGSVPNQIHWTAPFIGPPASGVHGWAPALLHIPEVVPLPGLAQSTQNLLGLIGFDVRTVMLMSRDDADRLARDRAARRSAPDGGPNPLAPPRRDGTSLF